MTDIEQKNQVNVQLEDFKPDKGSRQGVDIVWKDVKYSAVTKLYSRDILKSLSGICKHGEMTAIMGSSGAGKTTLLNILCCRAGNTASVTLSGDITANGQGFDAQSFSNFAAYVMQEDILMETMTVKEAMQFAANLKMTGNQKAKDAKVLEVLKIMRLEKCQNTLIGGVNMKGITKGEKKRTSIAFELVSDPDVIFLDEPTSGLDSFTAYNVIDVLQDYAKDWNKTIICTIHQPSGEIFMKFDRLILLVDGRFIYQGKRDHVIDHFSAFGFQCPHLSNPADYFMSIMHGESQENKDNYPLYFEKFETQLKPLIEQEQAACATETIIHKSAQATSSVQLRILIIRSFLNLKRDPLLLRSRIIQAVILGVFTGLVYLSLPAPEDDPSSQRTVNDYNGALFFILMIQHMNSLLPVILNLPQERAVFLKEENSKLYTVSSYFISKLVVETCMVIGIPIIFGSICYYMVGLNPNFGRFCFFHLVSILMSFVGNAQGMFCGSLFDDPNTAVNIAPLMIMPFMLFGGFYKNSDDMPSWNKWIMWISNYRYAFESYIANNFKGSPFTIDPVEQLHFDIGKWMCLVYLLILFAVYQVLALILLFVNKKKIQ